MITTEMIKDLKEKTGAGMQTCRIALELRDGIEVYAIEYIRNYGTAVVIKPVEREDELRYPMWHAYLKSGKKIIKSYEVSPETAKEVAKVIAESDEKYAAIKDIVMVQDIDPALLDQLED